MERMTQTFEITNPGSVPCAFRFLPSEEGSKTSEAYVYLNEFPLISGSAWMAKYRRTICRQHNH
jgi:hypothetical protein